MSAIPTDQHISTRGRGVAGGFCQCSWVTGQAWGDLFRAHPLTPHTHLSLVCPHVHIHTNPEVTSAAGRALQTMDRLLHSKPCQTGSWVARLPEFPLLDLLKLFHAGSQQEFGSQTLSIYRYSKKNSQYHTPYELRNIANKQHKYFLIYTVNWLLHRYIISL